MSKLTLDALKERADFVVSGELLTAISGGTENACHDSSSGSGNPCDPPNNDVECEAQEVADALYVRKPVIK